jgi:hypothetical protein
MTTIVVFLPTLSLSGSFAKPHRCKHGVALAAAGNGRQSIFWLESFALVSFRVLLARERPSGTPSAG